jgi:hypothetical protein
MRKQNKLYYLIQRDDINDLDEIKLLLQDPEVDPFADDNYALKLAYMFGNTEVVSSLLSKDLISNDIFTKAIFKLTCDHIKNN